MYGLDRNAVAAVRGFGELTPSDGMDAWVAALLHLRARAIEGLGDDAHEAFAQADLLASYVSDRVDGPAAPSDLAIARLEAMATQVSQIGWHDAVRRTAEADFDARVNRYSAELDALRRARDAG